MCKNLNRGARLLFFDNFLWENWIFIIASFAISRYLNGPKENIFAEILMTDLMKHLFLRLSYNF